MEIELYDRSWEDFEVGQTFATRGITVTESHVVMWSMVGGDWLPIHVDHEAARQSPFGQPLAHGPLTLSLALGLVVQSGLWGDGVVAWLGLDEVRLPTPVMIGDTIRVVGTIVEHAKTRKADRGRITAAMEVRNQRDEVVMTLRTSLLLERGAGGED